LTEQLSQHLIVGAILLHDVDHVLDLWRNCDFLVCEAICSAGATLGMGTFDKAEGGARVCAKMPAAKIIEDNQQDET
jgi:hypothetical protein